MIDRKDDGDLPKGTVAYREYEVVTDTEKGSMAFTLGEPGADTVAARYAKDAGAQAYGLISIFGFADAPKFPVIWIQTSYWLSLTLADGELDLTDDLKQIISLQIAVFFADIAPLAPDLAALHVERGKRLLN